MTTHGHSKTDTYKCWKSMIQRCYNPRATIYRHYGGKGVTVCERWRQSFPDFLADIGWRPSKEFSLDRFPDGRGNYDPGNVRWATDEQQGRNKPDYNHIVEWNGERKTLSEWESILGCSKNLIGSRLAKGWTVEEAMTAPVSWLVRPSLRIPHTNVNIHACGRYCVYVGTGKSRRYVGMRATVEEGIALRDSFS